MQSLNSWLKVIVSAALIGSFARFVFFILLAPKELLQISTNTPYQEILRAFFLGFRFDLSAICYLTLIFWLTSLLPKKQISLFLWQFLLTLWSFLLIIDIGYFSFYNDRINVLVFGFFEDDTWALVKTFWKNYPVLWILFATFLIGFFYKKVIHSNFKIESEKPNLRFSIATRAIVFIILFIGARGTFALFPLGDHDTVVSSRPFLNTLSFSTAHAFARAVKLKNEQLQDGSSVWNANLKEFGYLNQEDKAFEDFFQQKINPKTQNRFDLMRKKTQLNLKTQTPPHVVLVVMESWGYYGLQFQNPTFDLIGNMKQHFTDDLLNINFISTTGATTGSLSCLLAGIPQRSISPFLTESNYLSTLLTTSPAAHYKKAGYQTHFVYGGNPGWRDMNKYALAQGFDSVSGEVDIEKKLAANNLQLSGRHDWGVFDEDVFKYVELVLKEATSPQMIVVMTTTNHPPYELPKTAAIRDLNIDSFPEKAMLIDQKLAQNRFAAFRYSSDALSNFLDIAKKDSALSAKTVVAVTADHTFWVKNFTNAESFMRSAVPFYLYIPQVLKSQLSRNQLTNFKESFGSHQDIWPTLYELSFQNSDYETFGRPLFQDSNASFALNHGRFFYTKDRAIFVISKDMFSSFQATSPTIYEPTSQILKVDTDASIKYRSLMGSLDSYLHHSKIKP